MQSTSLMKVVRESPDSYTKRYLGRGLGLSGYFLARCPPVPSLYITLSDNLQIMPSRAICLHKFHQVFAVLVKCSIFTQFIVAVEVAYEYCLTTEGFKGLWEPRESWGLVDIVDCNFSRHLFVVTKATTGHAYCRYFFLEYARCGSKIQTLRQQIFSTANLSTCLESCL